MRQITLQSKARYSSCVCNVYLRPCTTLFDYVFTTIADLADRISDRDRPDYCRPLGSVNGSACSTGLAVVGGRLAFAFAADDDLNRWMSSLSLLLRNCSS